MTSYTVRLLTVADNSVAAQLNDWAAANGYGSENFSAKLVPVDGSDDAESTHCISSAQITPDGPGGFVELFGLFQHLDVKYAALREADKVLTQTNVPALEASIGSPLTVNDFLTNCGLKPQI